MSEDPDWEGAGITFKVATGKTGVVAEPAEGSGEMPLTFIPLAHAETDLAELRKVIAAIEKRSPGSYVAEFIAYEVANPLDAALARVRPAKPEKKVKASGKS